MPTEVTFTIEHCGQPVTGLWCDHCRCRSGIAAVLLVSHKPTVYTQCRECKRRV